MPSRRELANAIRALSMDAVQKAKSGHPGAPMGMADIAEVLWNDFMHHNPANPEWFDRDRFVLSNGHGSMLIYSLLHLTGYELSMDDLKAMRPAWRPRRVPWARVLPMPWAWRWPSVLWRRSSTAKATISWTITPMYSWVMAA